MNKQLNDRRSNLKQFYKFVRICRKCRKKYGTDFKTNDNFKCPVCNPKSWNFRRRGIK